MSAGRWRALTDWAGANESNLMGIESIAADPSDPARVSLAAGTCLTSGNGVILSSTDYGRSFERHSIAAPMGGNANGRSMGGNANGRSMGERLAVDPNLSSRLHFGSRYDGLFVSEDSARSWQRVDSFPVLGALDLGVSFVLWMGDIDRSVPREPREVHHRPGHLTNSASSTTPPATLASLAVSISVPGAVVSWSAIRASSCLRAVGTCGCRAVSLVGEPPTNRTMPAQRSDFLFSAVIRRRRRCRRCCP